MPEGGRNAVRINVYSEEMTDRVEIISKEIEGQTFTGLRLYLELPAMVDGKQYQGPFMHRPGDDDSSAVTFWGKRDLREVLRKALAMLDEHYDKRFAETAPMGHDWHKIYEGADVEACSNCPMERRPVDGGQYQQHRVSTIAPWEDGAAPYCKGKVKK